MDIIKKRIKKFLFGFIVLILIVLVGLTSVGKIENSGRGFFGNIISVFQKTTFNIGQTLANSIYSVQNIVKMKEENILLTETVQELQERIRILENIVNKSDALETEYKVKTSLDHDYVIGQVIALDNTNWFSRLTIDKGKIDGLSKNDIVIHGVETENGMVQIGLVGIVTEVGDNWSKVVTLLDGTCKISFRDINNEESGILQGSIDGNVSGYFFNSKIIANKNDSLVTSGIGEIYLPDIYIGKVNEIISTTDASMRKIVVTPAVDFTKLYKVFILKIKR